MKVQVLIINDKNNYEADGNNKLEKNKKKLENLATQVENNRELVDSYKFWHESVRIGIENLEGFSDKKKIERDIRKKTAVYQNFNTACKLFSGSETMINPGAPGSIFFTLVYSYYVLKRFDEVDKKIIREKYENQYNDIMSYSSLINTLQNQILSLKIELDNLDNGFKSNCGNNYQGSVASLIESCETMYNEINLIYKSVCDDTKLMAKNKHIILDEYLRKAKYDADIDEILSAELIKISDGNRNIFKASVSGAQLAFDYQHGLMRKIKNKKTDEQSEKRQLKQLLAFMIGFSRVVPVKPETIHLFNLCVDKYIEHNKLSETKGLSFLLEAAQNTMKFSEQCEAFNLRSKKTNLGKNLSFANKALM